MNEMICFISCPQIKKQQVNKKEMKKKEKEVLSFLKHMPLFNRVNKK